MRLALISDIHGNHFALEAVLADIRQQGADAIVCLGDVATLGPQPLEVLATVQDIGAACIKGNHEAALLDLDRASDYQIGVTLHSSLRWCAEQLPQSDLDYMAAFAPTLELELAAHQRLFCFHGSPQSNIEIIAATTAPAEIDRIFGEYSAPLFVGGHTHIQMLRQHESKLIINPGSVGSAFKRVFVPSQTPELLPWAEYACLTCERGRVSVDLRRIPFDIDALTALLARSDIPIRDWWLEQYAAAR